MNYKNKVFNKLFTKEVELSKEAVELGVMQDLLKKGKDVQKMVGITANDVSEVKKATSIIDFAKVEVKNTDRFIQEVDVLLNKVEAAFTELGVKPSKEFWTIDKSLDSLISVNKELKKLVK